MTIDRVQSPPIQYDLLPDSEDLARELGGDVHAEVAAMVLLAAKDSRDGAREAKTHEERLLRATEDAQVEHMHAQADAVRSAAWYQGVGQIGAGFAQVGSALSLDKAGRPTEDSEIVGAGGEIFSGLTSLASAESRFAAAKHEADATSASNLGAESKRRIEDIRADLDDARDLKNAALDFLRNTTQAEAATDQAAIFLRG